jgi:hypothetical protein
MNTLAKNHPLTVSIKTRDKKSVSTSAFWKKLEDNRFGLCPIFLVVIACVSGITAAVGIEESTLKLAGTVFPTVIALSTILGVMPMRVITISCSLALFIDLLILIF